MTPYASRFAARFSSTAAVLREASWFEECPRNEKGHCEKKGAAGVAKKVAKGAAATAGGALAGGALAGGMLQYGPRALWKPYMRVISRPLGPTLAGGIVGGMALGAGAGLGAAVYRARRDKPNPGLAQVAKKRAAARPKPDLTSPEAVRKAADLTKKITPSGMSWGSWSMPLELQQDPRWKRVKRDLENGKKRVFQGVDGVYAKKQIEMNQDPLRYEAGQRRRLYMGALRSDINSLDRWGTPEGAGKVPRLSNELMDWKRLQRKLDDRFVDDPYENLWITGDVRKRPDRPNLVVSIGDDHSVSVPDSFLHRLNKRSLISHNHPSDPTILGKAKEFTPLSFSPADYLLTRQLRTKGIRAIGRDSEGRKVVMLLRPKPGKKWPHSLSVMRSYRKHAQAVLDQDRDAVSSGQMAYRHPSYARHEIWKRVAADFPDLRYVRHQRSRSSGPPRDHDLDQAKGLRNTIYQFGRTHGSKKFSEATLFMDRFYRRLSERRAAV